MKKPCNLKTTARLTGFAAPVRVEPPQVKPAPPLVIRESTVDIGGVGEISEGLVAQRAFITQVQVGLGNLGVEE
jgi:hypothetical protein